MASSPRSSKLQWPKASSYNRHGTWSTGIDLSNYICEGCIINKQSRLPFPSEKLWRVEAPLQLVHTDICGPIEHVYLGGNRYFIPFIDDFG